MGNDVPSDVQECSDLLKEIGYSSAIERAKLRRVLRDNRTLSETSTAGSKAISDVDPSEVATDMVLLDSPAAADPNEGPVPDDEVLDWGVSTEQGLEEGRAVLELDDEVLNWGASVD